MQEEMFILFYFYINITKIGGNITIEKDKLFSSHIYYLQPIECKKLT